MRLLISALLVVGASAGAEPVSGSLDVQWNTGAADCTAEPQPPLQVHAYEAQTFILRQSPCAQFEAPFLYLLIGIDKALLIDTGAVADPAQMPLASTVLGLVPDKADGSKLPLLIVHSHGHEDHHAGDTQFQSLPSVQVVSPELDGVREFFGFQQWPDGIARLDLGGRTVEVVPAPGHHPAHVVYYDDRTGVLFSGDFLLPARLLVDDIEAYRASAQRIVALIEARPVAHVLGAHIELDRSGALYPFGISHHPDERRLELTKQDLLALPAALQDFNGFYARHPSFVITNPLHNLMALVIAGLLLLTLAVWGLRAYLRRRRRRAAAAVHV